MSTHADANFSSADFSALTASRRSIRAYTDQQVPQDILDAILEAATTAPSWSNTRAFRVALATGERTDRLREEYVRRFNQTLDIQHHKRFATIKTALKRELPDGDFPVWKPYPKELRAPQVMLQTLFLSAKAHGVDSCAIGVLSAWRGPVEQEFEIPQHYKLITGFCLGYADTQAPINQVSAPRPPIQLLEGK